MKGKGADPLCIEFKRLWLIQRVDHRRISPLSKKKCDQKKKGKVSLNNTKKEEKKFLDSDQFKINA